MKFLAVNLLTARKVSMLIKEIFNILHDHFGNQLYWWPGDTPWEIVVGAILTQQVAWTNVEKAIASLKDNNILEPEKLVAVDIEKLQQCVRPSGFYRQKSKRLVSMAHHVINEHLTIERMLSRPTESLREELVSIKGIGFETADAIMCYAGSHPVFVVDEFTRRMARCVGLPETEDYHGIQQMFMNELNGDNRLYKEYHGLIDELGFHYCKKSKPRCEECPLKEMALNSR